MRVWSRVASIIWLPFWPEPSETRDFAPGAPSSPGRFVALASVQPIVFNPERYKRPNMIGKDRERGGIEFRDFPAVVAAPSGPPAKNARLSSRDLLATFRQIDAGAVAIRQQADKQNGDKGAWPKTGYDLL